MNLCFCLQTETDSQNDIGTVTRTVTEEKVVTVKRSSPMKSISQKPWKPALPDLTRYVNSDYAMIIVFTCITIITLSFVLENKME